MLGGISMPQDRFIKNIQRVRVKTEGLQRLRDEWLDKKTDDWLHQAEKRLPKRRKIAKTH